MLLVFRLEYQLPCLLRQTVKNYAFLAGHIALKKRNCCSSHRHIGLLRKLRWTAVLAKAWEIVVPSQLVENCHTFNKPLRLQTQWQVLSYERPLTLTLFDMGGEHDGPPKCLPTTAPKSVGGGSRNLVTPNINLCSIKKSYFWFPKLSSVTMATSLSGSTQDPLKLLFYIFPYNEILKVFKGKI